MPRFRDVLPELRHRFDGLENLGLVRAVASCAEGVTQHLCGMPEHTQAGDAEEFSRLGVDSGARENATVRDFDDEFFEDGVHVSDLRTKLRRAAAVDRLEVRRTAGDRLGETDVALAAPRVQPRGQREERVQRAREAAVGDALQTDLEQVVVRVHGRIVEREDPLARMHENRVVGATERGEGDQAKAKTGVESGAMGEVVDEVHRRSLRRSIVDALSISVLAIVPLVGCARESAPKIATEEIVRFMHDPIRIDGRGSIAREDFHRYVVRQVASDWLPVLAVEAALPEVARAIDAPRPEAARVLELQDLIRGARALRARFPAFPKPEAAERASDHSETCTHRLALCLAWLETMNGEPSDDPLVHAQRLESAILRLDPRPTPRGAQACGVAIDAREVWPEVLARSDLAWRENLVRRALGISR